MDQLSILRSFQESTGLELCIKIFHPLHAAGTRLKTLPESFGLHLSPFCREVKKTRKEQEQCKQCDLRDVLDRCRREKEIFIHRCHADASEVIVPVYSGDSPTVVAYLGQFRTHENDPGTLPLFSEERQQRILALARILQSYLAEGLNTPTTLQPDAPDHRKERILQYLRAHLRSSPNLSDLARHLGTSTSRAGHVIRESTGSSFVELRDSIRLERSQNLLRKTCYKIAYISAECGFSSPEYFHRFFREKTDTTPGLYRQGNQIEA